MASFEPDEEMPALIDQPPQYVVRYQRNDGIRNNNNNYDEIEGGEECPALIISKIRNYDDDPEWIRPDEIFNGTPEEWMNHILRDEAGN